MFTSIIKLTMTLSAVGVLSLLTIALPAAAQDANHHGVRHNTNTHASTRYREDRGRAKGHYRDQDTGRAYGHYRDHDNRGNAYGTYRDRDDRRHRDRDDRRHHASGHH